MNRTERNARARASFGVVHHVDTVNREMAVLVDDELLSFDVPVGCAIVLHGERIKLRMVQPHDRVKIQHANRGGLRVALAIEVLTIDVSTCWPISIQGVVDHWPPHPLRTDHLKGRLS